jgi:hypothetical protein
MLRLDSIVFVNYRRSDAGWPADLLADRLKDAFGNNRVFIDVRNLQAGDDFPKELTRQLRRAAVLLVLIGKQWLIAHDRFGRRRLDLKNDWVRREIRLALNNKSCKVIPVLLDDADLPDEDEAVPTDIRAFLARQRIRVRQTHSDHDIGILINTIEREGFHRSVDPSASQQPADVDVIRLTKSKSAVAFELRRQIGIGQRLLTQLRESPPSSQEQLDNKSREWHSWRQYSEQLMRDSFSTLQPLEHLKRLTPGHLNFGRPWRERAAELLHDVEQETAYFQNVLIRLSNYEQRKASTTGRRSARRGQRRR